MISAYYFDISAFVILLCLIYAFFLERMQKILENYIMLIAIVCVMLASLLGIIRVIPPFNDPKNAALFLLMSDLLTAFGIVMLVLFVYRISVYNAGIIKHMVYLWIPFALDVAFCSVAMFSGDYRFRVAAFAMDLYMLVTGLNILIFYKKNSSLERTFMLIVTFIGAVIVTVIDAASTGVELQRMALTLLLSEEFFSMRNPDEQYDVNTGLLGEDAFREAMRRRLFYLEKHANEKLYLVMLAIHGSETFPKLLGDVNEIKLRKNVMDELMRIADGVFIFRLRQGLYVYMLDEEGEEEARRIQNDLNARFKGTFGKEAYEMEIHASTCFISLPEMADTLPSVTDLIYMADREGRINNIESVDANTLDSGHEAYMREVDEKVRNAVSSGNLEVYYQPIYSLEKKKYVSAEALIRLHDGDGFIPPDVFIPVAERNGTIIEIDDFMMGQVCKMIADRKIETLGIHYVEINLSIPDMIQEDLPEKMSRYMEMYHIKPSQLNIEITETSADTFTGLVEENVHKLSKLGFRFTLDDFGTGYSSLSRIIMLPFGIIKLDKSIVQPPYMLNTKKERANAMTLLESSADMIHKVGSETVAEGVETEEQLKKLQELDTEFIQGYYFARPMPESEFINAVKTMNRK
ncbi:MAG: EAL domain-containing protein [Lachnospiraceae bacterium]|nr:EAL domain-containing protein [Lachnospiraceae bacterium]